MRTTWKLGTTTATAAILLSLVGCTPEVIDTFDYTDTSAVWAEDYTKVAWRTCHRWGTVHDEFKVGGDPAHEREEGRESALYLSDPDGSNELLLATAGVPCQEDLLAYRADAGYALFEERVLRLADNRVTEMDTRRRDLVVSPNGNLAASVAYAHELPEDEDGELVLHAHVQFYDMAALVAASSTIDSWDTFALSPAREFVHPEMPVSEDRLDRIVMWSDDATLVLGFETGVSLEVNAETGTAEFGPVIEARCPVLDREKISPDGEVVLGNGSSEGFRVETREDCRP